MMRNLSPDRDRSLFAYILKEADYIRPRVFKITGTDEVHNYDK